jgi:putative endopeptidase
MRISQKVVRVVGPGVWLAAAVGALVVSWQPVLAQQAAEESHGVVVGNMDPAVKPGDNFFRYCNGAWLARTEIPADRGSVGAFLTLRDKSDQRVKELVEDAAKANAAPGTKRELKRRGWRRWSRI